MTIFEKYNFCSDLAYRTYMAFNGVINPINKAAKIIFDFYRTDILGYTNKKYITIYLNNFIHHDSIPLLELDIVETVLHELSHQDQDIDLSKYNEDAEYLDKIERANETNTIRYMIDHLDDINSILNTHIEPIHLQQMNYINIDQSNIINFPYKTISFERFYIDSIINIDKYVDKDYLINKLFKFNTIILKIRTTNNPFIKYFIIKYQGQYEIETGLFNNFVLDNYGDFEHITFNITYSCNYEDSVYHINIEVLDKYTEAIKRI